MSLKLGTQDIAGISQNKICNAHFLLEPIWSDHLINDISFLRADTFSWQDGGVYPTVYNHFVQDLQGTTAETETIGNYTVTFYRATDGHKICLADQEQTVLNIYNTYGIAWYYLLDTTNTQFKFPRTKYGFEGLRTNVGDKIDESLPNITSSFGIRAGVDSPDGRSNVIFSRGVLTNGVITGSDSVQSVIFTTQASLSSSTYQDNAPVQERAIQMYLYFYVGDYTQSAIEQTAGLNSELFNGKADTTLSNVPATITQIPPTSLLNFDGQWVYVNATVSQATAIGSYTIDLSSYLPNDNYTYECMFAWDITTVANGLTGTAIGATNAYSYNGIINGGFTNHILTGKTVTFSIWNSALQSCNVKLIRYRRLGTNQ